MRQAVRTEGASKGNGPYSQAIVSGEWVYVSGQGPLDEEGRIVGDTIEEQAEATLKNIEAILAAAGSSMDEVVKVGVFLADLAYFQRFNAVYRAAFREPYPARTCVAAGLGDILVEIDVVAKKITGS